MLFSSSGGQSLHILGTPLRSLELTSLKRIANGNVYVLANPNLCYVDTIDWRVLFDTNKQRANVAYNRAPVNCSTLSRTLWGRLVEIPSLIYVSRCL